MLNVLGLIKFTIQYNTTKLILHLPEQLPECPERPECQNVRNTSDAPEEIITMPKG